MQKNVLEREFAAVGMQQRKIRLCQRIEYVRAQVSAGFALDEDVLRSELTLRPGELDIVSPTRGDIHVVRNALADQVSISIHLYGGNIGRVARHVFVPDSGEVKNFVSGYSNALAPNLWARSSA